MGHHLVCLSFFPTSEGFTMLMNLHDPRYPSDPAQAGMIITEKPEKMWRGFGFKEFLCLYNIIYNQRACISIVFFFSGDVLYCSMVWNSFYFNDSWDDQNCLCFIVWDGLKSTTSLGIGNGCKEERGTSRPATMKATVSIVFATPSLPSTPCSLADKFTQH